MLYNREVEEDQDLNQEMTEESGETSSPEVALEERIGYLEKEAEEYKDLLQRVQADFSNYKKRVDNERSEQAKMANACLIQNLLPIIDDLKYALSAVPSEITESDWVQGIALVERKFREVLREEGVCCIEAEGEEFDPYEHEAVMTEDGEEEGKVVHVLQEGYKLHDKLLRPARVVVTKRKTTEEKED